MIPNSVDGLTADDINRLVEQRAEEGPTLEFKRELPGDDRDSRKEFLADVCALANARGGDIVYGIQEGADGTATAVAPLAFMPDAVITQLTNVLTDGLEPRLHGVAMKAVDIRPGGRVLVVRVPRSVAGIHRSARDGHFWVRETRSKRQLDVAGITNRIADVLGRQDRVADLFAQRYAAASADLYPLGLDAGPKVVLHIVPARDLFSAEEIDLAEVSGAGQYWVMPDSRSGFATHVYEGILHHPPIREQTGTVRGATIVFRSGLVEAVGTAGVMRLENTNFDAIPLERVEHMVVQFLRSALRTSAERLCGGWPVTVRVALVGHGDYPGRSLNQDVRWHFDHVPPVRVRPTVLQLPDVILDEMPASIPTAFRHVFDRLWQAFGYPQSHAFTEQNGQLFWNRQPA